MTEITDDEAAEVLWASSEPGSAAVMAACRKADELGLTRTAGRPAMVIEPADIGAIVYAAHLAAAREHPVSITGNDRLDAARAGQLPSGLAAVRAWTGHDDAAMAYSVAYGEARELARNLAAAVRRLAGDQQ